MKMYHLTILWENDPNTRLEMYALKMEPAIRQTFHMTAQGHGVEIVTTDDGAYERTDYFPPSTRKVALDWLEVSAD